MININDSLSYKCKNMARFVCFFFVFTISILLTNAGENLRICIVLKNSYIVLYDFKTFHTAVEESGIQFRVDTF